jgi:hypothetical protein
MKKGRISSHVFALFLPINKRQLNLDYDVKIMNVFVYIFIMCDDCPITNIERQICDHLTFNSTRLAEQSQLYFVTFS